MKIKHLFCLLLLFYACGRSKQAPVSETGTYIPEVFVEDSVEYYPIKGNLIKADLTKPQEASLFDYFSHIELIPLETSDDVLVGNIKKIIYCQNRYYILDLQQQTILVFDDSGKFLFILEDADKVRENTLRLMIYASILSPEI